MRLRRAVDVLWRVGRGAGARRGGVYLLGGVAQGG